LAFSRRRKCGIAQREASKQGGIFEGDSDTQENGDGCKKIDTSIGNKYS
jgi:hypothetical protein